MKTLSDYALSTHILAASPLHEISLRRLSSAGFSAIEIWGLKPHFSYNDKLYVTTLKNSCSTLGISVSSVHAPFACSCESPSDFHSLTLTNPNDILRQEAIEETITSLNACATLNCRLMTIHVGHPDDPDTPEVVRRLYSSLEKILPLAESQGIRIALENICSGLSTATRLSEIVDCLRSASLGICLDIGHAFLSGEDPSEAIYTCAERIFSLHIHDNHQQGDTHLIPGRGLVPWQRVSSALKDTSYAGLRIIELPPQRDLSATLNELKDAMACLQ